MQGRPDNVLFAKTVHVFSRRNSFSVFVPAMRGVRSCRYPAQARGPMDGRRAGSGVNDDLQWRANEEQRPDDQANLLFVDLSPRASFCAPRRARIRPSPGSFFVPFGLILG